MGVRNVESMQFNVTPLGNQVLFRNQRNEASALVLPTEVAAGDVHSVVMAVGPDCKSVAAGDQVLTSTEGLLQLPWSGEPLYLCPETSIVAKLAPKPQ